MVSFELSWFLYCWVSASGVFSLAFMHVLGYSPPPPSKSFTLYLVVSLFIVFYRVFHVFELVFCTWWLGLCFPQRAGYVRGSVIVVVALACLKFLVPGCSGALAVAVSYTICHDNLFLTEGCFFSPSPSFSGVWLFWNCALQSPPFDVMKIVICPLCCMPFHPIEGW